MAIFGSPLEGNQSCLKKGTEPLHVEDPEYAIPKEEEHTTDKLELQKQGFFLVEPTFLRSSKNYCECQFPVKPKQMLETGVF